MKVNESIPLDCGDSKSYTVLVLDGRVPDTRFTSVLCGAETIKTVFMSGGRLDAVAVEGIHDFTGREVTFA